MVKFCDRVLRTSVSEARQSPSDLDTHLELSRLTRAPGGPLFREACLLMLPLLLLRSHRGWSIQSRSFSSIATTLTGVVTVTTAFEGLNQPISKERGIVRNRHHQRLAPFSPFFECRRRGDAGGDQVGENPLHRSRYGQLQESSKLALAPMMDYTDRHFRHLVRLVSNRTLLYTEMVSANAIAYESRNVQPDSNHVSENQPDECGLAKWRNTQKNDEHPALYLGRFLASSPIEGPSVLQLGGSDPQLLQEAARVVHEMSLSSSSLPFACDYSGLNLNCGCPSPKVAGKGCFGAALMSDPGLVAKLASALYEGGKGQFPVSVKCRIGTDDPTSSSNTPNMSTRDGSHRYYYGEEEYRTLCHFIETVARDGIVRDFSIHARIAVLGKSFSPADNRRIPPLQYGVVRRLAREYPTLRFTLNGGVGTIAEVEDHLTECPELAGIMVGRAWTADPWSFAMADSVLYRDHHGDGDKNRWQILQQFAQYADHEESTWGPVKIRRFLIRAVSPLFAGEPNAKKYRIALDKIAGLPKIVQAEGRLTTSGPPISELILDAAQRHLSEETLFSTARESYERRYWLKQEPSR